MQELRGSSGPLWPSKPSASSAGVIGQFLHPHWKHVGEDSFRPVFCDIAWSSRGEELAAVSERGVVTLLCPQRNTFKQLCKGAATGFSIAFSAAADEEVIVGASDGSVSVFSSGIQVATLTAHDGAVHSIAPLPSGAFLSASASQAALWSSTWERVRTMHLATPSAALVQLSARGGRVAALLSDGSVPVWEAAALEATAAPVPLTRLQLPAEEADVQLTCLCLCKGGKWAAAGSASGSLFLWSIEDEVSGRCTTLCSTHCTLPSDVTASYLCRN